MNFTYRLVAVASASLLFPHVARAADPASSTVVAPTVAPAPFGGLLASLTARSPTPFFVRLGGSAVLPQSHASVGIGGAPVPGAGVSIAPVGAFYAESGYYLSRAIAVSFSGGFPPTLTNRGAGTLASQGTLFKATVGIPVLAVTYHYDGFGRFRPYVGGGVGYAIQFRSQSGSLHDPSVHNSFAPVIVAGIDYDLTDHWGVFVDAKRVFLKQRVTGTVTPIPGYNLPSTSYVRTDPTIVSAGVSYRF